MKRNLIINPLGLLFFSILFISCATSTGSRYSKNNNSNEDSSSVFTSNKNVVNLVEDFDITPYKTKIEVPGKIKTDAPDNNNIWYDYSSPVSNTQQKVLVGTKEGYRVLVTSTDNLEDANQIKSGLVNSLNENEVYIDFEPPFYKVKAGDFDNQTVAENLRFKLNQLGYTEAKVIHETINVFKL
jgi:hypothetical protein